MKSITKIIIKIAARVSQGHESNLGAVEKATEKGSASHLPLQAEAHSGAAGGS